MLISGIPQDRVNKQEASSLSLRHGQVALGKVNKIYPNNRAEVQVGGHRFIAQIETPLAVGERYVFQVEQKDEQVIHLRVIASQVSETRSDQMASLLRQLNIRVNDVSVNFVQSLMKEQIPFTQRELVEALRLLDRFGHSENIQTILKQMLLNKVPIQEGQLRALLAVQTQSISATMANALASLHTMSQTPQTASLQALLGSLLHPPTTEQLSTLPTTEARALMQALQMFNYLPASSLENVQHEANRTASDKNIRPDILSFLQAGGYKESSTARPSLESLNEATVARLLSDLHEAVRQENVRSGMNHFVTHYKALHSEATNILQAFNLSSSADPLSDEQFTALTDRIINQVIPLLSASEQEVVRTLLRANTPQNIASLQALLQSLAGNQFYSVINEALIASNAESTTHADLIPQRFILHLEQMMQTLGLSHEAVVKTIAPQQETLPFHLLNINETVKAMLLQVTQDERAPMENVQQLVHFINGLQLQAREENKMLQAQLQLPGEKLGLPDDLFIKFEGRKTKDDEIDTEFCRILFFLNLHHIKETIIDMNIQKRVITLTVYNEYDEKLAEQMNLFKDQLAEGLQKIDYRLSNVRFKPLDDNEVIERATEVKQEEAKAGKSSQEGFDLRI